MMLWVVDAKEPLGDPAQVLEYLGRYMHRVAISNEHILGMDRNSVHFRVRDSANGNRKGDALGTTVGDLPVHAT